MCEMTSGTCDVNDVLQRIKIFAALLGISGCFNIVILVQHTGIVILVIVVIVVVQQQ